MTAGTTYLQVVAGERDYEKLPAALLMEKNMECFRKIFITGASIALEEAGNFGNEMLRLMLDSNLLVSDGVYCISPFRATLFEGYLLFSDPDVPDSCQAEYYVDPIWDNYLAKLIIRKPYQHALDMGGGSGFLSIVLSSFCESVCYVDLNPRAVEMARFNAKINNISNIQFRKGDLFTGLQKRKFDYMVFNSPTDKEGKNKRRLLEAGEGILETFLHDAPFYLVENGICQVSMGIYDDREKSMFEKIDSWFQYRDAFCRKLFFIMDEEETDGLLWRRMWMTAKKRCGKNAVYYFSYDRLCDQIDGNVSSAFIEELLDCDLKRELL